MPCRVHVRPAISYELPEMPSRRFELHRDGGKTPVPVVWDSAFSCGFGLPGALPEHAAVAVSWLNKLDADGRAATAAQNRIHEEFNEAARVHPEGALALKKRVTELEQQLGALQTQFDLKAKECETLRAVADKRAQDLADGLFDEDGNPVESANELEALRAELEKGKGLAEKFEQLKRVHAAFIEAQGNLSRQNPPVEQNPVLRGVAANDAARAACDFAIAALHEADEVADGVIATMNLPQLNAASASGGGVVSGAFCAAYTGALRAIQKHREQFIEPPQPKPPGS